MEMAQLALQAGYPAEAKAIIDKGFAAGALGTGAEAERHKRLRDLAVKQEAESAAGIAQAAHRAPPREQATNWSRSATSTSRWARSTRASR